MKLQQILDENSVTTKTAGTVNTDDKLFKPKYKANEEPPRAKNTGLNPGAEAKQEEPVSLDPRRRMKRLSFLHYATTEKECPGCATIKAHGWDTVNEAPSKRTELTCQMCGAVHKKGNK